MTTIALVLLILIAIAVSHVLGGTPRGQDPRPTFAPPAPEIDTGGFLLYQPSLAAMQAKSGDGPDGWGDPIAWTLCGFAYGRKTRTPVEVEKPVDNPVDKPTYTYTVQLWLARMPINAGVVQKFYRYGAENSTDENGTTYPGITDGPLLYSLLVKLVDGVKTKKSWKEFEDEFRARCAIEPPTVSTSQFRYFLVTESEQIASSSDNDSTKVVSDSM